MANDIIDPSDNWNPDFDDGKPTVWAAEWFGPEEKIVNEEDLAEIGVHVIYNGEQHFTWFYPQIKAVLDEDKVREFIEFQGITNVSDADVEELKAFFFHWIRFTMFEINLEDQEGRTFEPEDVNEVLGDSDVTDITDELERAGMKKRYEELMDFKEVKPNTGPTLH